MGSFRLQLKVVPRLIGDVLDEHDLLSYMDIAVGCGRFQAGNDDDEPLRLGGGPKLDLD